jgi:hypothetical protein
MVAMFILLVGGLAILNIFPPALKVIRGSESREVAISLTQSLLERYNSEPDSVPEATYNDDGSGVFVDANAATSGTRNRNFSLPKDGTPAAFNVSALNGFKRVVGEKHRVLTGTGGLFVLTHFANTGNAKFYVEEEILGVKVQSATPATDPNNGRLDFTNARLKSDETVSLSDTQASSQLADGTAGSGELKWTDDRLRYYVSYRYFEGANVAGVEDERIDLSTSPTNRVFQSRATTPKTIIAGEISMRVRIPITGASVPTGNQPAVGYAPVPNVNDILATSFAPRLVNVGNFVSVDYTVSDWRRLIFDTDATVPTSKNITPPVGTDYRDVKLPVSELNDQPLFAQLFNKTANGLTPQSNAIGQWSGDPVVAAPPVVDVSSASATLEVPTITIPTARVSYQTSRGWAQQVSVAAKTYYPFDAARLPVAYDVGTANSPGSEREPWREYSWSSLNKPDTLYFRASEVGKTVLVTFRHAGGLVTNQVVPIDRDIKPATNAPAFAGSVAAAVPPAGIAQAVLTDTSGNPLPATAILSVRGASILSRTAWIENKSYIQEVKEGYRPLN